MKARRVFFFVSIILRRDIFTIELEGAILQLHYTNKIFGGFCCLVRKRRCYTTWRRIAATSRHKLMGLLVAVLAGSGVSMSAEGGSVDIKQALNISL
jgi:hypothetical protein